MALLPVIIAPDPRLKMKSAPVAQVDDGIRELMDDMRETMCAAPGVGLAGPQVGVHKRVIVVETGDEGKSKPLPLANPEILWVSKETIVREEGCLSLPGHFAEVRRPAEVKVRYLDYQNETRELLAVGTLANCIQHEIEHLEGILFVDHLSALRRNIILRKLVKARKTQAQKTPAAASA